MMNKRIPIPITIASQVLLANRHACCVCQKPQVQLHHIDENRANNDPDNIAVLCLTHHDLASMQIGLCKKLKAEEVRIYKKQWESKCAVDIQALARDRLRFYATVYKNPPRIRELFSSLQKDRRLALVKELEEQLAEDQAKQKSDTGFKWQANPGDNDLTRALMFSLRAGDLWPRVLPRVVGHPYDPDYPIDLGPPNGMTAFHGFDLYCQLMTKVLALANPPLALESLWALRDPDLVDQYAGYLISFRERAIGRGIFLERTPKDKPLGNLQFRVQRSGRLYRANMAIKNMYVFSDTAGLSMRHSKVCGVAILEDAERKKVKGKSELLITLKPLIIGIGGLGQSTEGGWYDLERGKVGDHTAL
jgi:hypothetical protein